jgi:hypothetical protein
MLTRRIAVSACTLCLAIPAAAGASQGANPPPAKGPYGLNPAGPRSTVQAKGPYGIVPPGPRITTKGINAPLHPRNHAAGASHRHATNGWRAAAVAEAALLAALALGWTLVLPARRRPPRLVT